MFSTESFTTLEFQLQFRKYLPPNKKSKQTLTNVSEKSFCMFQLTFIDFFEFFFTYLLHIYFIL